VEGSSHLDIDGWMECYLKGEPVPSLPLLWPKLTPFARDVYEAMATISFGSSLSYGQLAALAGFSKACRAVGTVCKNNRFPLIIPCHRVVASRGLGGFAFGLEVKKALHNLEQNVIMQKKV